jgi:ABC-type Fe3+/spermidine/putrescine transport system ATPase subunit/ABC-type spermidine/putrescine transport system permease subunit II
VKLAMAAIAAVVAGFLALPVLALLPMSLSGARWLALPPRDLSLRWYVTFLTDRDWIEATLVSLRVAAGATVLAVGLGTLAGAGLARAHLAGRDALRAALLSPLVVPVMVVAVSLYHVFGRAGLVGTPTGLTLAHALLGAPYVVLNVEAVMRTLDPRLERAARVLGASAWQAFWRVTLPLARPGVLAGALFAFIASLDEVVVAMFLSGTGAITLPKLMWDSITQDELNPVVAAVATLQVAAAVLAFGTSEALRARGARRLRPAPGRVAGPGDRDAAGPPSAAAVGTEPVRFRPSGAPLRLVDLHKRFGAVAAVDGVTLAVEPGELVALLGPSGSGKTTLLALVAGLEAPTSGEIRLGDRTITREPPERRGIGMVFQDYALWPHLTVSGNVAFPLRLRRAPPADVRSRVGEMLALVGLTGLERRLPRELSGGQQQRVALARALVFQPRLLLMDEPFGALEPGLRARLGAELRRLQRRLGLTVLLVTHDRSEALALSDRIVVLDRGRIQQVGRPAEIYDTPANRFVAELVGDSVVLRCAVVGSAAGALRVRSGGGSELVVAAREPGLSGGDRHLVLRPASLRLHTDGRPRAHALRGVVEGAGHLGGAIRYLVRINPGEVLAVQCSWPTGTPPLAPGTDVQVEWDPAELRLL